MRPLITPDELSRLLGRAELVLLDASYQLGRPGWGREQFRQAHLPGAVFVDVDTELAAPVAPGTVGGRHPLPDPAAFQAAMRRAGVGPDSHVVAYDQSGSLAAARLWWLLRHHGHDAVQVLDGGLAGWRRAGHPVTDQAAEPAPGSFTAAPGRLAVVDAEQVPGLLAGGHAVFDVRAPERFHGHSEPIDPVAGHIPGATNLPASGLQQADGSFLPPGELADRLARMRPGDAVSCGSGLTACQVQLAAASAGIEHLALYAGSWSDWISDPTRPVATDGGD